MTDTAPARQVFSVSQLNRAAKDLLESYLPLLWVEGELSNLSRPSSGHWYFTLKDERAQVRCAMFRNRNLTTRLQPNNGDKVLLRAQVSLYEGRGDFQLIVEHMEPAGAGDLQRQFEALKAKLAAEGLFDAAPKQALPRWPKSIGVITSATGAALADILHVLRRRAPFLPVKLLPVPVQGAEAAPAIVRALELANRAQCCDVLIVGRGGGSLEDLWAFNEEIVARAVFASRTAVISAVGHEVDFSICDFVADLRAPTPSAAAELVSPDGAATLAWLRQLEARFTRVITHRLLANARHLQHLQKRLQHPRTRLQASAQRLDSLELRLAKAWTRAWARHHQRLAQLHMRLGRQNPTLQLAQQQNSVTTLQQRLQRAMAQNLERNNERLRAGASLLQSVSPLATLERGYAIIQRESGEALRDAGEVSPGERVSARLARGRLRLQVERIEPQP